MQAVPPSARRHHAFRLVLWGNAAQSSEGGSDLLLSHLRMGVKPKRIEGLAGNSVVPVVCQHGHGI
jgi:hypothetical protein